MDTQTNRALPAFRNPFRNLQRPQSSLPPSRKTAIVSQSPRTRPIPRRLASPGSSLSGRSNSLHRVTQHNSSGSSVSEISNNQRRVTQHNSPGSSVSGKSNNLRRVAQHNSPGSSESGISNNLRRVTQHNSPGSSVSGRSNNLRRVTQNSVPGVSQALRISQDSFQTNSSGDADRKTKRKRHAELTKDLKKIFNSDAPLEKADEILDNDATLSEFCQTLEAEDNDRNSQEASPILKRPYRATQQLMLLTSDEEHDDQEDEEEEDFFVLRPTAAQKRKQGRPAKPKRCARDEIREATKKKKEKKKKTVKREKKIGGCTSQNATSTSRERRSDVEDESDRENKFEFHHYSTWVECVRCLKWRHLVDVLDPASLVEDWQCCMNPNPTAAKLGCSAPPDPYDTAIAEASLLMRFTEGSLVWARVPGFPAWPAMVDRDPDINSCFYLPRSQMGEELPEPSHYHVTFLDKDVSRAWVASRLVKPFRGISDMKDIDFTVRSHDYRSDVLQTAKKAEEALKMDLKYRMKRYGFAFRWTGVGNRWASGDKKDKKRTIRRRSTKKASPKRVNNTNELRQLSADTLALTREANKLLDSIADQVIASQ